jgi:hypothetical protein
MKIDLNKKKYLLPNEFIATSYPNFADFSNNSIAFSTFLSTPLPSIFYIIKEIEKGIYF